MSMRISNAAPLLLALVGCGLGESPEAEGESLDCAIGTGADFASVCTLEWVGAEWEREFIIHHPGGSFRRFALNEDATGVVSGDGAEDVRMLDPAPEGFWQFSLGGDQYRMPLPPPPKV